MEKQLKKRVILSLFWKFMERSGTQGVTFIVSIVLARLLTPDDYGMIAVITVFISLANVFIQSGFNTSLIQRKNVDDVDFSSAFYLSLVVAALAYTLLFLMAPFIANFYNMPGLTSVLRVLALTLFFGAVNSIQNAKVSRELAFKKLFYSSLGASIISGIVGIIMAYLGFGVWALVGQQLVNQITICIIMWFCVNWRPQMCFSLKKIRGLFSYGWKILISSLIDTLYQELQSLVIGKKYTSDLLGYYSRGKQFPQLLVTNMNGAIQSVMLPTLSMEQDNVKRLKEIMRRSVVTSSFLIFPMMLGLAGVAEPLVQVLLTDKWLPCVPFMQISCLSFALWPIHTANLQAINAMGRSDIFLKIEVIKKVIGVVILVISVFYFKSVMAIVVGNFISGIISTFINSAPNKYLMNYGYLEQIKDIMPSLLISLIMNGAVMIVGNLGISMFPQLILQILTGAIIYILIAHLIRLECYIYIRNTLKDFRSKSNR